MTTRRLSKRENGILILCALLLCVYVGYSFVIKPFKGKSLTFEGKIDVSERRLKNNFKMLRKEPSVNEEYEKYISYFKQESSDEKEMASILSEIESVANEINMRVADMKPRKVKPIDFYNNFSVTLTLEGELPTILHFLYLLQNAPHLFLVDEIFLERSSIRTSQLKCRLILSKTLIP